MNLKNLALAAGIAAALVTTGSQAASVSPAQSFTVNTSTSYTVFTPYALGQPTSSAPWYYELVNNSFFNLLTKVELVDTLPDGNSVNYKVYVDSDMSTNAVDTAGGAFASGTLTDTGTNPFFTFVMNSGTQYVLELSKLTGESTFASQATISAVPLPGAIWLFGSALLGFLGFSSRRKI